jgi:hypothetical protein
MPALNDWFRYFGDATLIAAILDCHAMHIIAITISGPAGASTSPSPVRSCAPRRPDPRAMAARALTLAHNAAGSDPRRLRRRTRELDPRGRPLAAPIARWISIRMGSLSSRRPH